MAVAVGERDSQAGLPAGRDADVAVQRLRSCADANSPGAGAGCRRAWTGHHEQTRASSAWRVDERVQLQPWRPATRDVAASVNVVARVDSRLVGALHPQP